MAAHDSDPVPRAPQEENERAGEALPGGSQKLLLAMAEATGDLIYAKDREGRYLLVNSAAARLVGKQVHEVLGRTDFDLHGEILGRRFREQDREVMATGRPLSVENELEVDGARRTFLVTEAPLFCPRGAVAGVVGIARDITERKQAERALALLAQAGEVFQRSLDPEQILRALADLVVPALADWSSVDVVEGDGSPRRAVLACADPASEELARGLARYASVSAKESPLARVLESGQPLLFSHLSPEVLRQAAVDGEPLRLIERAAPRSGLMVPFCTRHGEVRGVLGLGTSMSGRTLGSWELTLALNLVERATLALENALLHQKTQRADERKNEFLAMLSHELRNPLGAIAGAADVLARRSTGEAERARAVQVLSRQVRHMGRLLDDLLDVARITRGLVELRRERVELVGLLEQAVEANRPLIDARGHSLCLDLGEEPMWLVADSARIVQVVSNLLENAAKYTPPGGSIALEARREGGETVIRVRDDGAGIAPHMLDRVFELFVQGERGPDRAPGGLGVGLTLVKRLVELHGGRVCARIAGPKGGTEMEVRLPVTEAGPSEAAPGPKPHPRPPLGALRVLVVDDREDAAEILAELLGAWGHDVRVAHDGHAAVGMAHELEPDLALLDIGLPGLDGLEVARRIRAHPSTAKARLVALSGYGRESDRRAALAAGFDEYLVKPIGTDELLAVLARCAPAERR